MNPAPPENTRDLFDPLKTRENIFKNVKNTFQSKLNTLESPSFKLKVTNVHYPEEGKEFTIDEQKNAILEKKDLTVPVKAHVELISKKDNSVVDKKEVILARVPWLTQRNTTILHGVESQNINQQRLKSGVYCRTTKAGLLEGHVNVESGSGLGGRVVFDPQKSQFFYKIQNSQFHLYSLLKDMGTPDSELEQDWGKDLLNRNRQNYNPNTIDKLYAKIFER